MNTVPLEEASLIQPLKLSLVTTSVLILCAASACSNELPRREDPRLIPMLQADRIWNGVTTTADGRIFVGYPSADGPGVEAEELMPDGSRHPYPDAVWNSWKPGEDVKDRFVQVNALRIGPDGSLWIIDAGAPGLGKTAVAGAARLFQFDLSSNRPKHIYNLASATHADSYIDDIRFNGRRVYITDAGAPGLIVLDQTSGLVRRVLDNDPSTTDTRVMRADNKILLNEKGKELRVHADQLEVSPNGQYLYYQPSSGPLARIETKWLDDASLPASDLAQHVEATWVDTPTTGGTAIDAQGTIYLSDTNRRRVLEISPAGKVSTLIEDPRLIWSDAMWIDDTGFLWIPATQQNLTPGFTGGKQEVNYPVWIYKMLINQKPPANDHP